MHLGANIMQLHLTQSNGASVTMMSTCQFSTNKNEVLLSVGIQTNTTHAAAQAKNIFFAESRTSKRLQLQTMHSSSHLREDACHGLVGLNDDVLVELAGVQTEALVESRALVVVQVHSDVHGQAEEAAPQLGLPVIQELGLGLEHGGEEVSVPAMGVHSNKRVLLPASQC